MIGHADSSPGLLVSVRHAAEAAIAEAADVDVIDIKEPRHGPLGRADDAAVAEILNAVGEQTLVSIALGELVEGPQLPTCWPLDRPTFAKIGLSGCATVSDWPRRLRAATADWPDKVARVGVVYADYAAANAPPPDEVLAAAAELAFPIILVDTWDKSVGSLLDNWPAPQLAAFAVAVRRTGCRLVLAGSLNPADLHVLLPLQPALVGVRGAVCEGGRTGPISRAKIVAFRRVLQADRPIPAGEPASAPAARAKNTFDTGPENTIIYRGIGHHISRSGPGIS